MIAVGATVYTLDDLEGKIMGTVQKGPQYPLLYLVVLDGLEGLGTSLYREEELRPAESPRSGLYGA